MQPRPSLILCLLLALLVASLAPVSAAPPVEEGVQAFLDEQPGLLKTYQDSGHSAAAWLDSVSAYYGVSPRVLLALLEATNALLSDPQPAAVALRQPFGAAGPAGFGAQMDWAARELRAGLGPYQRPPVVRFTDGTTLTLTLDQAAEGVAVQRLLAKGRSRTAWRSAVNRFGQAFEHYFDNQLPDPQPRQAAGAGFLSRPWPAGTRVTHLAYFDHMYPTVDTGQRDNGYVVNFLGRGSVQYDGHDGHDYLFPDQPIGTPILAAADGLAYARTHRGNGVVILHPDGYETVYWHLDKFASIFKGKLDRDTGVQVRAGDLIGTSGKSGFVRGTPHLHFEVRRNGRQVDPYGWYGPGDDPCIGYAACEASAWLWRAELAGEFDFTPPGSAAPDRTPPLASLAINPPQDLLFLAHFDGAPLQQVGQGSPIVAGAPAYPSARFGSALRLGREDRLAVPLAGNLQAEAGTIALWVELSDTPPTSPQHILAASAYPGGAPIYTGTLALDHTRAADGTPRWIFWSVSDTGQRHELTAPDTLTPGPHHLAISWDRTRGKALYLDGVLAARAHGTALPTVLGEALELGRITPSQDAADLAIDQLAIYRRALDPAAIAALAAQTAPLVGGVQRVATPDLQLDVNALDDAGGIVGVQTAVDGQFGDPQPYDDQFALRLPAATGSYTVSARFFDRAGNATAISTTVTLEPPPSPQVRIAQVEPLGVTLIFSDTGDAAEIQVQPGATPDFTGALWRPLPQQLRWYWFPGGSQVVWVRFRDSGGLVSAPQAYGPAASRLYLPLLGALGRVAANDTTP